jgi:hypothetical protein
VPQSGSTSFFYVVMQILSRKIVVSSVYLQVNALLAETLSLRLMRVKREQGQLTTHSH